MHKSTRIMIAYIVGVAYALSCSIGAAQTTASEHKSPTVDVFILAGQSNMEGVGRTELLPDNLGDSAGVHLYHSASIGHPEMNGQWLPLRPAGWSGGATPMYGVEMKIGPILAEAAAGSEIYLIKHAVGGTTVYRDWDPIIGTQYQTLQKLIHEAMEKLKASGLRPVIRGIFWQQGEADARHEYMASAYQQRLEHFVTRLRASLAPYAIDKQAANIRFVLGQVIPDATPQTRAAQTYPFRDEVRNSQLEIAKRMRNVVTVPTDMTFETHASDNDGYRDDDNIHFNGPGLFKLGSAMANAYLDEDKRPNDNPIASLIPRRSSTPGETLRVLAYNTYYVFSKGEQIEAATNWIAAQDLDIVALQELTNITDHRLTELATGWNHAHSALLKTSGFSVGVTSRFPVEVVERILEGLHHGCLHVRIEGVHVFVVHLSPFRWETRMNEAELLLKRIRPVLDSGEPVLVLGDFNAVCKSDSALLDAQPETLEKARASDLKHGHVENLRGEQFDYAVMQRFLEAGLADCSRIFVEQSRSRRWTFPTGYWSDRPNTPPPNGTRIDYILTNDDIAAAVLGACVPRHGVVNQTSDHYPVFVEFRRSSRPPNDPPAR